MAHINKPMVRRKYCTVSEIHPSSSSLPPRWAEEGRSGGVKRPICHSEFGLTDKTPHSHDFATSDPPPPLQLADRFVFFQGNQFRGHTNDNNKNNNIHFDDETCKEKEDNWIEA